MSTESEDERIARWERDEARRKALHRHRMRWWKHAREYVSMKRLFVNRLVGDDFNAAYRRQWVDFLSGLRHPDPVADPVRSSAVSAPRGQAEIPDSHPPWSGPSNWWPKHTYTGSIHE